ncbi:hypothetical protein [Pseudomonas graminis]|uniref:hypothetical protein n=1 Tax=Pseudomonas graminis TaxID=158627 RepID=UPI003C150806
MLTGDLTGGINPSAPAQMNKQSISGCFTLEDLSNAVRPGFQIRNAQVDLGPGCRDCCDDGIDLRVIDRYGTVAIGRKRAAGSVR